MVLVEPLTFGQLICLILVVGFVISVIVWLARR